MANKTKTTKERLPDAVLILRGAADWGDIGANRILDWLNDQKKAIRKKRGDMAKTYRAAFYFVAK